MNKTLLLFTLIINLSKLGLAAEEPSDFKSVLKKRFSETHIDDKGIAITFKLSGPHYYLRSKNIIEHMSADGEKLVVSPGDTMNFVSRHSKLILTVVQGDNKLVFLLEQRVDTTSFGGDIKVLRYGVEKAKGAPEVTVLSAEQIEKEYKKLEEK